MLKKIKKLKNHRFFKNLLFFLVGIFVLIVAFVIIWLSSIKIPDFHSFEDRLVSNSTKIYDRTGQILLYDLNQDVKRTNIPLAEMGDNLTSATIAIEDSGFYSHGGIKITSIIRAAIQMFYMLVELKADQP